MTTPLIPNPYHSLNIFQCINNFYFRIKIYVYKNKFLKIQNERKKEKKW